MHSVISMVKKDKASEIEKTEQIFAEVLKSSSVSDAEYSKLMEKVEEVVGRLKTSLEKKRIKAEVMLGGSAAKGTLLAGDFDCDVFVRFDSGYSDEELPDLLEKALTYFDEVERVHGSRDYFQFILEHVFYEFVPVLLVDDPGKARNVTDISPLHVGWIKKKLEDNPDLKKEVLLAKLFCKAQGLYGAESYISGFSGHVLDILIVYYGSFLSLLKNAVAWGKAKVIDVEGHGSADDLNESKISPLILIDPIQKDRNAAAALGQDKLAGFKKAAKDFLAKPSAGFFKIRKLTDADLKKNARNDEFILLKIKPLDGKKDVVGSKLLKVYNHLRNNLVDHDFSLVDSGWDWDGKDNGNEQGNGICRMWFVVEKGQLPKTKTVEGPPVKVTGHAEKFKSVHPQAYEEEGRLYAEIDREFRKPDELVQHFLKSDYVKERISEIR